MDFDDLEETEQARCEEDCSLALQRLAEEEDRRRQEEEARLRWEIEVEVTASIRVEQPPPEAGTVLGILVTIEQRDPSAPRKKASAFFCEVTNQALKKLRGLFAEAAPAAPGLAAVEEHLDLIAWFLNIAVQRYFRTGATKHFARIASLLQSEGGLSGFLSELMTKGEHRRSAIMARFQGVIGQLLENLRRLVEHAAAGSDEERAELHIALERAAAAIAAGTQESAGTTPFRALAEADSGLAAEVARWRSKYNKLVKTSFLQATRILHELRGRFTQDGFREKYQDLRARAKTGDPAHVQLLNMTWSVQSEVLPKYGYPATPAGLWEMRQDIIYVATNSCFEVPPPEEVEALDLMGFDMVVWKLRRDIHLVLDMGQPLPKMVITREMIEKRREEEENERRLRLRPVSRHFRGTEISPMLAYYAQGDHRGWGRGYDHFVRALDDLRDELPRDVMLETRRGRMRIINMPDAEARREFMKVKCVDLLQERLPWLDVDFSPGIRSGDVPWRAAPKGGGDPVCRCGGRADAETERGPACCSCDSRLDRWVPFFGCSSCGGVVCQNCKTGCRCGGQVFPLGSGTAWPCGHCGAKLESATYYSCGECGSFLCPCCAGKGRAEAEWRGHTVAMDTELWGPPEAEEAAEMRAAWERDAALGPDAYENSFKYYNEGCDFTKRMSHGFVGSHLAHFDCWRQAAEGAAAGEAVHEDLDALGDSSPDWLLVVEDDALPLPEFELDWGDVLVLLCREIAALRRSKTPWDLIWVGRSAAMGPEPAAWPEDAEGVPPPSLLVRPGYCILIHCYCLSRRGLQRLVGAPLARTVLRPLDEVFGALNLGGRHLRGRFAQKLRKLGRGTELLSDLRCLAFPFRGLVTQLEDTDEYGDSDLAASHQARNRPPAGL